MNKAYISQFLARKSGKGDNYNYDLKLLIHNFSFLNFIYDSLHYRDVVSDYGGFIVITNNQYIIGYNAGYGIGSHVSSFARTMADLKGIEDIKDNNEAIKLYQSCRDNYITARIIYSRFRENEFGKLNNSGSISFELKCLPISQCQFNIFKMFYNNYNKEIEFVVKKFSNFFVEFSYIGKDGKVYVDKSNNLDNLYVFLENNIDNNKIIRDEENIIGVGLCKNISNNLVKNLTYKGN